MAMKEDGRGPDQEDANGREAGLCIEKLFWSSCLIHQLIPFKEKMKIVEIAKRNDRGK